ncbi:MAG: hypothetical protein FJ291_23375 [Planctomycetes bacterium]|nr:hypothetical protein [Planctomycetota bacterium]
MGTAATSQQVRIEPTVDPAAAAFADKHGLWPDIELAVELLHDVFPELVAVRVSHVIDPESTDCEYLRVESRVPGGMEDMEEILDREDAFSAALRARMDAERRWFFVFTVIII